MKVLSSLREWLNRYAFYLALGATCLRALVAGVSYLTAREEFSFQSVALDCVLLLIASYGFAVRERPIGQNKTLRAAAWLYGAAMAIASIAMMVAPGKGELHEYHATVPSPPLSASRPPSSGEAAPPTGDWRPKGIPKGRKKTSAYSPPNLGPPTGSNEPALALPLPAPAFPWPPPEASAAQVVPSHLIAKHFALDKQATLGDVDAVLTSALMANGYGERSYYAVPHGFALVTRLEQIEASGKSKLAPERWNAGRPTATESFSLISYLLALFRAKPGYYRLIVFIVTDNPFAQSDKAITSSKAVEWLHSGLNILPPFVREIPYSPNFVCTAMIYEFKSEGDESIPQILLPSHLDAATHLSQSGIWAAL